MRLALLQEGRGERPTGEVLVPGVVTWSNYKKRRALWTPARQKVGLDAEWWEGAQELLFPLEWLDACADRAAALAGHRRQARGVGVDPAEGGDMTSMAAVDGLGLLELVSVQTPDTSKVPGMVAAFGRKWGVDPENWAFDRGGGGYEHACTLRSLDFRGVRTVGFGEVMALPIRSGKTPVTARREVREEKYVYKNRRAQMYHDLSLLCDPRGLDEDGQPRPPFALPRPAAGPDAEVCRRLHHQLQAFPRLTDPEGRYYLPPKHRKDRDEEDGCLEDLIGHSPDEADAVVLAVHAMLYRAVGRTVAGVL